MFGEENDVILKEVAWLFDDISNILAKRLKIKRLNSCNFWRYFVHPTCLKLFIEQTFNIMDDV